MTMQFLPGWEPMAGVPELLQSTIVFLKQEKELIADILESADVMQAPEEILADSGLRSPLTASLRERLMGTTTAKRLEEYVLQVPTERTVIRQTATGPAPSRLIPIATYSPELVPIATQPPKLSTSRPLPAPAPIPKPVLARPPTIAPTPTPEPTNYTVPIVLGVGVVAAFFLLRKK